MEQAELIKGTNILKCLECGKCTANCPISRYNPVFSPRKVSSFMVSGDLDGVFHDEVLWSCLTCGMCNVYCPSDVNFSEFIRNARRKAVTMGLQGTPAHGGTFYTIMHMMESDSIKQDRTAWIEADLKTSEKSEYLYFVGCNPYFDEFFKDIEVNTLDISRHALKILNALGIEPVVLKNERCCGHDLLWTGDVEGFKRLAAHNLAEIARTDAKKIVFSCAEGYRTFKIDIPHYFGQTGLEVLHISELLARQDNLKLVQTDHRKVTFQDPCRLGRHCGVYEEPRNVLQQIENIDLVEMTKNRNTAVCCGTSAWMNCDTNSKKVQKARLEDAKTTGADLLVTSCPKCYIHFTCTQHAPSYEADQKIEIQDLSVLVGKSLT